MTDFAFEVISEEELQTETVDPTYDVPSREGMVYCEWCKGFYFPEYHFGREIDDSSDNH